MDIKKTITIQASYLKIWRKINVYVQAKNPKASNYNVFQKYMTFLIEGVYHTNEATIILLGESHN